MIKKLFRLWIAKLNAKAAAKNDYKCMWIRTSRHKFVSAAPAKLIETELKYCVPFRIYYEQNI